MQVTVSFKNMESTPTIEQYAREKISELVQKFAKFPKTVFLIFENTKRFYSLRCSIATADLGYFYASSDSDNFFAAIDKTYEKLKLQLGKRKLTHRDWQRKFMRRGLSDSQILINAEEMQREESAVAVNYWPREILSGDWRVE